MCHMTGVERVPNVTAHRETPLTFIGSLLYGLILVFDGTIFSRRPHFSACFEPHTLTRAPVSAVTDASELLTITSGLKSCFLDSLL